LSYDIALKYPQYYKDIKTGLRGITFYIDGENRTTNYEDITLSNLKPGPHTAYFTLLDQKSENITFYVIGESEISTPEVIYEYVEGTNTKIPLSIIDKSELPGTINVTVKDQDSYKLLSTHYNVGNGNKLSTETLVDALESMYGTLNSSYTINITYSSEYAYPSSTEFILNVNDERNTNIIYNIINNTEGNLQINITVLDGVTNTQIPDANIQITGDITKNTTSGIITDDTLTSGDYTITVQFPKTENYKASQTTINFNVEEDFKTLIENLNAQIRDLQSNLEINQYALENAQNQIEALESDLEGNQSALENAQKQIEALQSDLEGNQSALENAQKQIEALQKDLESAQKQIETLQKDLESAQKQIKALEKELNGNGTALENATINIDVPDVTYGENATVTVTLPKDATGNVTIGNVTVPVVDGTASAVVSGLPVGNNTLPVVYSGDDKYNPIETVANVTVKESGEENATVDIDAHATSEGNNATITVTLPEDATGNVTATVGNNTYTTPIVNGTATISIPDLDDGNYLIPVTYSGDDKYNSVTKDVALIVGEDTSDIISAPDVIKYYSGSERFAVNITDYQGNPIANKSVVMTINGVSYTRTTDETGQTSIPLNLEAGAYNVTTTVENKTIQSVVTILSTVNGTDLTKVYRNGSQYYATFRNSEGNYLAEGTMVRFNINGVFYDRTTDDKGTAKLNINLYTGEYILTAMNPVTGEESANLVTVLAKLVENKDITKYFRNATQYTVKVLGDDGNPVGAGEVVTFNINGVFYNRTTDENGTAQLNINLQAGDYVITAEYQGFMVSNNIKVLPTLTAQDLTKTYGTSDQFVANLVDGQGKPYANQKIEFNINGVMYYRTTDSQGNAKLNINLIPGEYIITSKYNDAVIGNIVKIIA
ncbi:MAG: DUF745 domain-containing protein, partial [Methanobrevibacter sp.]|nr:DUF745 domain-containing protein [Methanobrevibacter sp.]